MKKIVTTIAALAMAVSMFAADFSATVQVKGDVAYGKSVDGKSEFGLLGVENTEQKDNDLLELNYAGDKAGAFVRFWTKGDFADQPLNVRALKLWFEPVAGVKITLGNNELALYKEQLDWWKVPCGASMRWYINNTWDDDPNNDEPTTEFNGWDGRWQAGAAFHETWGSTIEVTAIDGLYLGLGAASNVVNKFLAKDDKGNITEGELKIEKWGAVAKYSINGMSFGAAYKNAGNFNLLSVGADFSKDAFYGMIEGKLRFDDSHQGYNGGEKAKLSGITIDNYFAYNINGINIQLTAPVTIRGLIEDNNGPYLQENDPSYMTLRAKVTIPVDAFSVYVLLGSDEGFTCGPAASPAATVWVFDNFADNFNFYGKVGASLNVGVCALDLGAEFAYDKPTKTFAWAIPFTTKVAF